MLTTNINPTNWYFLVSPLLFFWNHVQIPKKVMPFKSLKSHSQQHSFFTVLLTCNGCKLILRTE